MAAALVCLCTVTVFAAPALLKMFAGDIGFFAADPAATAGPLAAPRGNYEGAQPQLEAYNAAVGQSVENGGVTMTLDTIAMDVSGMDAFFTIEGKRGRFRTCLAAKATSPTGPNCRLCSTCCAPRSTATRPPSTSCRPTTI